MIAHVYLASEAERGAATPDWTKAPSLATLRPLINNAFRMTRITEPRSVSDILVRVPDAASPAFGSSRYKVLARDYKPVECGANDDEPCESTCGESGAEA